MDPITQALVEYTNHLDGGGARVVLSSTGTERTVARKLHPSALGPGLCDRSAAYDVMRDVGELKVAEHDWQQMLSFRVGHIYQQYVVEALEFKGALIGEEIVVEDENWTGRIDILADFGKLVGSDSLEHMMLIDVKSVKSKSIHRRDRFYPRPFNIAQTWKYRQLLKADVPVRPYLFYLTRLDMETTLFEWRWDEASGNDCIVNVWDEYGHVTEYKTIKNLWGEMEASESVQIEWLHGGELPPRCGFTPDEHPFMCARKSQGVATPNCLYFEECWGVEPKPFNVGSWGSEKEDEWEVNQDWEGTDGW